ncbi:Sld5 domain-containing protein [Rhizoctonia solani AG-1 IA]|uniref:DNA replication complex GINS protein PSF2 n=1 Tax=Thanatephorus cucumeris (strain AG1-IA) TaxID=983506 RepID=L8X4Z3_THACA|nr:Sld5 domain-containing protein [Rhizoctonia solani AG-1 IA]
MALPPALLHGTSPQELEFAASEELVSIVPTISMERIRLMSVRKPPARTKIPLWFAANLKLKRKCYIVPPEWLNVEWLQEKLREETTQDSFSKMPFRAYEDIPGSERVRNLLKDIREARQAKFRVGLGELDHIQLSFPNICAMEINELRPLFIKAMEIKGKLFAAPLEGDATMAGTADATFGSGWADSTFDMDTS